MSLEYILEQCIIGRRLQIPISEARFKELANAREVLSAALAFEQRYELLLGNFLAMELAFSEIGLRAKVEPQYRYPAVAEFLEKANRHVVNLLTAMRGYADQVVQDFKCLELEPEFGVVAKSALSRAYDQSADYRFMCGMRNHVQHKATAVHGFVANDESTGDANSWAESVKFIANRSTLQGDRVFKTRILDEQPEKIDLRRCARRSVRDLGAVHLVLREIAKDQVARARSVVANAIHDYQEAGADSVVGLGARRVGYPDEDVPLFLDWDDIRLQLVDKNGSLPQLWPDRTHREPKVEQIVALREEVKHTRAQAAAAVFVSEERWQDYEAGLPMPEGLFILYKLQVGRHPTHALQLSNAVAE
ncbi:hypothetical protein [Paraburkholderia lycopersici]|uniref:Uncharacterized protein n=1 Tax=Paraburkholderia lycopersici TaxID=416944 RepID=A0A1G6UKQ6_9BURK|nr:hypothetical protein [Paraburkholderia lycopersici]SDD41125.1 hypothetical protein SAMN05421548_11921 [Paraburkholderia lycopersici]